MCDEEYDSQDDDSDFAQRLSDELHRALGRYMVALSGAFQPTHHDGDPSGPLRFFCFPGFVLLIGDSWLFVTAGHNLRSFKEAANDKQNKWIGMAWSQFVPDARCSRTLSLDNTTDRPVYFQCDVVEGDECGPLKATADWGILELTPTERQWMIEAGVKPFSLDDLKMAYDTDRYILIGLPTELFDKVTIGEGGATSGVEPTLIELTKREDLISQSDGQWFIGDLPNEATFNIHGMSGGPLFAIDCEGDWPVWIAGIQSHWCPNKRLSFVCPAQVILDNLPQKFRPPS